MENNQTVRDVQVKILETMKYIDKLCRKNGIVYYIMGGTALGAVRHGGFIPWDDDLDIFMTPDEYQKFKTVFEKENSSKFVIQEWKTTEKYLEYAKVRMNGTTFIEERFKDRRDLHQGIYVDIMILHKVPDNKFVQKTVYYMSKFVTLYALSQRGWKPKTKGQAVVLKSLNLMPCKLMASICYRKIYKYDNLKEGFKYCCWITPAKFKNGLFDASYFEKPVDVPFEDTFLLGSERIKEYLEYRYGDYMKLPPEEARMAAVHASAYDVEKDYIEYLEQKMKIEVLVTTMHQKDFSKYSEMNLQTDAVIANQADFCGFEETEIKGKKVRLVTTDTRGASINRNIAIIYSKADIIVFADDDQRFVDGYEKIIEEAFKTHPDADAIKFYCESTNLERPLSYKRPEHFKKASKKILMASGVPCFAVKKEFLLKNNITFNNRLGAGQEIFCGEDSLFLSDLCKLKANIYMSPTLISYVKQDDSTWFTGYNEKFFYCTGYIYDCIYGLLAPLAILRRALKTNRSKCSLAKKQMISAMYKGRRKHRKGE